MAFSRRRRNGPFPIGETFLSPEQRHLLDVRRAAEGRAADQRRAAIAVAVASAALATALAAAWLSGLASAQLPSATLEWRRLGALWGGASPAAGGPGALRE